MVHLDTQYYNLNRFLLLIIGLWPYKQSKFTRFQFVFLSTILSTSIIFQLTPFIILKCTSELIVKVLSSISFFAISIIKYNIFNLNIEVVKQLLMELQRIFNELKDENEIAIVEKYNCIAKRYTIGLIAIAVCGLSISITVQFGSNLSNIDEPINMSRSHHLPIKTEYFIDQEKYFYLILLYAYTTLCIGSVIILAIGTMLIMYLQYICGMFRIASYRIKHALNINILRNITAKNTIRMTEGIICAVDIHRQAMKLTRHLLSTIEIMMFCLIICGVVCVSINLFQIASSENNVKELMFPLLYVFVVVLYMFISNYIGQNVTDHNNHIFSTAYNVQWYRAPIHIQKMILFLLQRETREFTLNIGGLFNASIECFATLVKSSISYFTVIYSTR